MHNRAIHPIKGLKYYKYYKNNILGHAQMRIYCFTQGLTKVLDTTHQEKYRSSVGQSLLTHNA